MTPSSPEHYWWIAGLPAEPLVCQCGRSEKFHQPEPLSLEFHHHLPRAQQHAAIEANLVPANTELWPDPYVPGKWLFEVEGSHLTRTCHGNVHSRLVRHMKVDAGVWRPRGREEQLAHRAVELWTDRGLDLSFLIEHKLWGEL
jgi:hypothetical protein